MLLHIHRFQPPVLDNTLPNVLCSVVFKIFLNPHIEILKIHLQTGQHVSSRIISKPHSSYYHLYNFMNISFNEQINKKIYGCMAQKINEHFTIIQGTSSLKNKP